MLRRTALLFIAFIGLTGCDEVAPDNQPGAVNNPFPTLSWPEEVTFEQPDEGEARDIGLVIQLSRPAPADGHIDIETVAASAQPGVNYELSRSRFEFSEGQRQVQAAVTLLHDPNHTSTDPVSFSYLVRQAHNVDLNGSQTTPGRVLIVGTAGSASGPAEPVALNLPESLSFRAPANDQSQYVVFTFDGPAPEGSRLRMRSLDGSATAGTHFEALDDDWRDIETGSREFDLELQLLESGDITDDINFKLQFISAEGVVLPAQREVDVTLTASASAEVRPTLNVPASIALPEPVAGIVPEQSLCDHEDFGDGWHQYQLVAPLSEPLERDASVQVAVRDGSARASVNYADIYDTDQAIAAGRSELILPVCLTHEAEQSEELSFFVQLLSADHIDLGDQREIEVQIIDSTEEEQPLPVLSLSDKDVAEPTANDGSVTYTLWFYLSDAPSAEYVSVTVTTREGSAKPGQNYEPFERVINNIPNSWVAVPVTILHEGLNLETARDFQLVFSNPTGLELPEERNVTITINNADIPMPNVSLPTDVSYRVQDEVTDYELVLPFDGPAIRDGLIHVVANDDTAREGEHFEIAENYQFNKGSYEAILTLTVLPDPGGNTERQFELIITQGDNVLLPSESELRVIQVTLTPPAP
jgi:hypothetical protein